MVWNEHTKTIGSKVSEGFAYTTRLAFYTQALN